MAYRTDATTKLLSVVSEEGGGPWSESPGLTEDLLSELLEVQEDRGDRLRDKMIRKQEELARMEEGGEDDFLGPVRTGQSMDQAPLHFDPSDRSNQGQGTRIQASRDQDQQTPGQGRGVYGNRPTGSWKPQHSQGRPGGERGEEEISHHQATHANSQC